MEIKSEKNAKYYFLSTLKYLSLIFVSFIMVAPLILVVFGAFKTNTELLTTNVLTLPENWLNFDNFITAWTIGRMAVGFMNTAIILLCSITATILTGTMTGYDDENIVKAATFALVNIANTQIKYKAEILNNQNKTIESNKKSPSQVEYIKEKIKSIK